MLAILNSATKATITLAKRSWLKAALVAEDLSMLHRASKGQAMESCDGRGVVSRMHIHMGNFKWTLTL